MPKLAANFEYRFGWRWLLSQGPCAPTIPRYGGLIEQTETLHFYQEYRSPRRVGRQMLNSSIIAFLGRLSTIDSQLQPLSAMLDGLVPPMTAELPVHYAEARLLLLKELQDFANIRMSIFVHRTHGDFLPWNCYWTRQGLFVFGWGESRQQGLAFGDAFYYVTAPELLKPQPDPKMTVAAALNLGNQVAAAGGFMGINMQIYLALWLLQQADKGPLYQLMLLALEKIWR